MKPVVLTFVRRYLPGYKAGGPLRTIANMVEHLNEELDFRIVTSDRDVSDTSPYPGIRVNSWNTVGKAQVYYLDANVMRLGNVAALLRKTPHDVLYLNSFFDPRFTGLPLWVRRSGKLAKCPAVLAPRGEFSEGALDLKSWKKLPYISLTRTAGLYRKLVWHASSSHEARDILRVIGKSSAKVEIAPNLPPKALESAAEPQLRQAGAPLRIVFVSRITPKKNLDFALRVLGKVRVPVTFSIVGPISDEGHWRRCLSLMNDLPRNIKVNVVGSVEHAAIPQLIAEHDLFFLPTRGENYGHVIAEAMTVGTPVLVADTTPWRDLREAGIGWDLPLSNEEAYVSAIEAADAKGPLEYPPWRQQVADYASKRLSDPSAVDANRRLFLDLCDRELSRTTRQA
jgi:glycosyltransferase involved in cell wall biosynthesis